MIPAEQRRSIVMAMEGVALEHVGRNGPSVQAEITRCQIDGLMNALIRMEGNEQSAQFAFALSDRVVAGVRAPTDCVFKIARTEPIVEPAVTLPMPAPMPPTPAPPSEPAVESAPPALTCFRGGYHWGLLHGGLAAGWLAWALGVLWGRS